MKTDGANKFSQLTAFAKSELVGTGWLQVLGLLSMASSQFLGNTPDGLCANIALMIARAIFEMFLQGIGPTDLSNCTRERYLQNISLGYGTYAGICLIARVNPIFEMFLQGMGPTDLSNHANCTRERYPYLGMGPKDPSGHNKK